MYNKKSKGSAALTILSALFIAGVMVLMPFLMMNTEMEGIGVIFVILVSLMLTYLPLYLAAIPYFIIGLVYGSRMAKRKERKKLISANRSMLIASLVLAPVLAWGLYGSSELIANSAYGIFPIIYLVLTAIIYLASIIAQIATLATLKKMPEEETPANGTTVQQ